MAGCMCVGLDGGARGVSYREVGADRVGVRRVFVPPMRNEGPTVFGCAGNQTLERVAGIVRGRLDHEQPVADGRERLRE